MYHLKCKCMLMKDGKFILSEGRARLLRLISKTGSITKAAKNMGMSYRHAWGILKDIEESLDEKIIESTRGGKEGGGSKLTKTGKNLLSEYNKLKEEYQEEVYKNPSPTVDGIIIEDNEILLIERSNPPFKGEYALPGGYVEYNEKVEDAVTREIEEETGLKTEIMNLVGVYSDPDRDPRGHTISTVYYLKITGGELTSGSDAENAKFFPLNELPELAFDHSKIISDFLLLSRD